jgi:hypothetical protein
METEPSAVRSNPRRGPGITFYEQAAGDGGNTHSVLCMGDRGGASPIERGKGGRNHGPRVPR